MDYTTLIDPAKGVFKQHKDHLSIKFLVVKNLDADQSPERTRQLAGVIEEFNKAIISSKEHENEESVFYLVEENLFAHTLGEPILTELEELGIDYAITSHEHPFRKTDSETLFCLMETIQPKLEYPYTHYLIQGVQNINSLIFKQVATNIALKSGEYPLEIIFVVSEEEYKEIEQGYKVDVNSMQYKELQLETSFLENLETPFQKVIYLERLLAYKPK